MIAMNPLFPGLRYESSPALSADNALNVFIKSAREAYLFGGTVLTKITDADYPGWSRLTPTSITRSGSTATVTLPSAVNWQTGSIVTIAGATQAEYNGSHVVTVSSATQFTFPVTGTPATPATGAITATGGRTTVPGIVYLDGYFFVMDENAVIYNSALNNPAAWNALDFISANIEPGAGVALAKSQNYLIALKSWSTEFFYDAANPVGSPLSPVISAFTLVGCASGDSVANIDGTIAWVSKTRQKGRAVHIMSGLEQKKISTPDIDRILNYGDLADVYSYGVKVSGHSFYVLGLRDLGITLAYDLTSNTWAQWTSLTERASKPCSLTHANGVATAVCVAHGLADGDPATVSGAAQPQYNITAQIQVIDANTFQYRIQGNPISPATGAPVVVGYDEGYFKFTRYAFCAGLDLVLHETTGAICEFTENVHQDAGMPINLLIRTGKVDAGNDNRKTNSQTSVIGNKTGGLAMIRWSDDDYTTYSAFRPVDLSSEQARITRCGSFRRRSYELRHVGNSPVQVSTLELDIQ